MNPQQLDLRRRRIAAIVQITLDGASPLDVADHIAQEESAGKDPWTAAEGELPLTPAQISAIVRAAEKQIASCYPDDDLPTALHKAKLQNCYARAVQSGDVRTARSILCDLAKISGLNRRRAPAAAPGTLASKAREATETLRARIRARKKAKVSNGKRATRKAVEAACSGRDAAPESSRDDGTAADAGNPSAPEALDEARQGDVGPDD